MVSSSSITTVVSVGGSVLFSCFPLSHTTSTLTSFPFSRSLSLFVPCTPCCFALLFFSLSYCMVSFSLFVVSMVFCSVSLQPVASNSGGVQGDQMTHRRRFVLTYDETSLYRPRCVQMTDDESYVMQSPLSCLFCCCIYSYCTFSYCSF